MKSAASKLTVAAAAFLISVYRSLFIAFLPVAIGLGAAAGALQAQRAAILGILLVVGTSALGPTTFFLERWNRAGLGMATSGAGSLTDAAPYENDRRAPRRRRSFGPWGLPRVLEMLAATAWAGFVLASLTHYLGLGLGLTVGLILLLGTAILETASVLAGGWTRSLYLLRAEPSPFTPDQQARAAGVGHAPRALHRSAKVFVSLTLLFYAWVLLWAICLYRAL